MNSAERQRLFSVCDDSRPRGTTAIRSPISGDEHSAAARPDVSCNQEHARIKTELVFRFTEAWPRWVWLGWDSSDK